MKELNCTIVNHHSTPSQKRKTLAIAHWSLNNYTMLVNLKWP